VGGAFELASGVGVARDESDTAVESVRGMHEGRALEVNRLAAHRPRIVDQLRTIARPTPSPRAAGRTNIRLISPPYPELEFDLLARVVAEFTCERGGRRELVGRRDAPKAYLVPRHAPDPIRWVVRGRSAAT
jgi:hypothetical protein